MKHFNRTRWRVLCPHNHVLKTTTTTGDIRELSSPRDVQSAIWQSACCPVTLQPSVACVGTWESEITASCCRRLSWPTLGGGRTGRSPSAAENATITARRTIMTGLNRGQDCATIPRRLHGRRRSANQGPVGGVVLRRQSVEQRPTEFGSSLPSAMSIDY